MARMSGIAWNEWILLGIFFFCLSLCWTFCYFFDNRKQRRVWKRPQTEETAFQQINKNIRIPSSLPWEGSLKLVLTGSFTILLVVGFESLPFDLTKKIEWSTIYLFFAITGLIDLHVYFCRAETFPLNLDKFSLCLCYGAQGVLISSIATSEDELRQAFIRYYIILITASAGLSAIETIHPDDSFKLYRALLASMQASWSYHIGLINQILSIIDGQLSIADCRQSLVTLILVRQQGNVASSLLRFDWLSLLFVWHIAGNLIITVISITICKIITCCRKENKKMKVALSLEDYQNQMKHNNYPKNVESLQDDCHEKCSAIDYPTATIDLTTFGFHDESKSFLQPKNKSKQMTRSNRRSLGRSMPSIDYSTLDCKAKLLTLDKEDRFRIVESKLI